AYPSFKIEYISSKAFNNLCKIATDIQSAEQVIGENLFKTFKYSLNEALNIQKQLHRIVEEDSKVYFYRRSLIIDDHLIHLKLFYQTVQNEKKEIHKIVVVQADVTEEI